MIRPFLPMIFLACLLFSCSSAADEVKKGGPRQYAIAIHGGAGAIQKANMSAEKELAYRNALDSALTIGEKILLDGGSALDAVTATISWMEDCPLFNAGKGAVFTHDGKNELDASIMEGSKMMAGAVGNICIVRHPIQLARAVMEKSPHVFLSGRGAEQFAIENGLDTVPPSWFYTDERWESLQKNLKKESGNKSSYRVNTDNKFGTVGCVALDLQGNLAAGTSTGGMTNKRYNRLGDSPIIGAGTYADNNVCAISCTGHGEFFIRYSVAHDVWALQAYKGEGLEAAADFVINKKLKALGAEGGLIAVDKNGNIAMPFNSDGMYRGYAKPGKRQIMIYKE